MDEELTPGRDAADAAAAGSADGPASGWRRLEDALGAPGSWRTDEGGERASDPTAGGRRDTRGHESPSGDPHVSLVDLTALAVQALRSATIGAHPSDTGGGGWAART